jgi:hypothetical protein
MHTTERRKITRPKNAVVFERLPEPIDCKCTECKTVVRINALKSRWGNLTSSESTELKNLTRKLVEAVIV